MSRSDQNPTCVVTHTNPLEVPWQHYCSAHFQYVASFPDNLCLCQPGPECKCVTERHLFFFANLLRSYPPSLVLGTSCSCMWSNASWPIRLHGTGAVSPFR